MVRLRWHCVQLQDIPRLIQLSQYKSHPASLREGSSEINPERAQEQKQIVVKEPFFSVLGKPAIKVLDFLYPGFTAILPYMSPGEDRAGDFSSGQSFLGLWPGD